MEETSTFSPVVERLRELADQHPDKVALVSALESGEEQSVSWRGLDLGSNRIARMLADYGVDDQSMVVIGVRNCAEHILVTYAAWKLGALMLPLRAELPVRERDEILDLARPAAVFADWDGVGYPIIRPGDLAKADSYSDDPLPNTVAHPGKAIASGGSTGRSKIVVDPAWDPTRHRKGSLGRRDGQIQLMPAPLYHNSPILTGHGGLMQDHTLVLMQRFDAGRAVDLIERYRVSYAYMPPIIMQRIAALADIHRRDLSSLDAIHSSAAPCPDWLKRAWIELIGPEKVYEVYGSTEGIGATMIRGDEWLEHPGSVGRPAECEMRILDEDGADLPPSEVGEIYMRTTKPQGSTFQYVGAPPIKSTPDGFASVGDLGWVDDDGFLFIADRRTDLIISGGANVYPAEVEGALGEHPGVADAVVIGVPDPDWGRRVHAIVQPKDPEYPPAAADLDTHVRERLTSYKAPKTYEFLTEFPRNEAGKIRRAELAAERESGWTEQMVRAR